jgi:IclR family mhp operon transcriptional activator
VNSRPTTIDTLVEAGASAILSLSDATGLGVDLAAPIGNGRVEIVDTTRNFSRHGIFPDCIGYRPSPFRSALGCAFLAALEPEQEAEYSARLAVHTTGKDRTAALALPAKLREVRAQGFAIREDGYWGRAVDYGGIPSAIAVAISAQSHAVGAVSLIGLAEQHSAAAIAKAHLKKLTETAEEIGKLYAANVG